MNKIYYIASGSVITGIIATSLYMMGYFPIITAGLITSLITAFIMLIFIMFASIETYITKHIAFPFTAGILGTISTSALALSTAVSNSAASTLLLVFLCTSCFTFMCSYFYKLIIYIISKK